MDVASIDSDESAACLSAMRQAAGSAARGDDMAAVRGRTLETALAQIGKQNHVEALTLLRILLCLMPGDPDVIMLLGLVERDAVALQRGVAWLCRSVILKPDAVVLKHNLWNTLSLFQAKMDSLPDIDWDRLDPLITMAAGYIDYGPCFIKFGQILWKRGQRERAAGYLADYGRAQFHPAFRHDVFEAASLLAEHELDAGRAEAAAVHVDKLEGLEMPSHQPTLVALQIRLGELRGDTARAAALARYLEQTNRQEVRIGGSTPPLSKAAEAAVMKKAGGLSGLYERKPAFFPLYGTHFEDIDSLIDTYVLRGLPLPEARIGQADNIFTFGSCFASNIADSLRRAGANIFYSPLSEEVNTTFANLAFITWLAGDGGANSETLDLIYGEGRERMSRWLREARFVILTVGVAPATFIDGTDEYVFISRDKLDVRDQYRGRVSLRTTTVDENKRNIKAIISRIKLVNPGCAVFITVSPVTLNGSFEFGSAIVADCVSKSVLRAAVHEALSEVGEAVYYWPSFEIVRWLGAHLPQAFFGEYDCRHVNRWVVDKIMASFIRACGDDELGRALHRSALA